MDLMKEAHELMEKENSNVVPFERPKLSLATDGFIPDGPGPWLFNCPEGAVVVVQSRTDHKDFNCGTFTIVQKTNKTVRLVNPKQGIDTRVIPSRFCNQYDFVEILYTIDINSLFEGEGDLTNKETLEETKGLST